MRDEKCSENSSKKPGRSLKCSDSEPEFGTESEETFPKYCICFAEIRFTTDPEMLGKSDESRVTHILENIFCKSKRRKWKYHPQWHELHMIKKMSWLNKRLSDLLPEVKETLSEEKYSEAKEIFKWQKEILGFIRFCH